MCTLVRCITPGVGVLLGVGVGVGVGWGCWGEERSLGSGVQSAANQPGYKCSGTSVLVPHKVALVRLCAGRGCSVSVVVVCAGWWCLASTASAAPVRAVAVGLVVWLRLGGCWVGPIWFAVGVAGYGWMTRARVLGWGLGCCVAIMCRVFTARPQRHTMCVQAMKQRGKEPPAMPETYTPTMLTYVRPDRFTATEAAQCHTSASIAHLRVALNRRCFPLDPPVRWSVSQQRTLDILAGQLDAGTISSQGKALLARLTLQRAKARPTTTSDHRPEAACRLWVDYLDAHAERVVATVADPATVGRYWVTLAEYRSLTIPTPRALRQVNRDFFAGGVGLLPHVRYWTVLEPVEEFAGPFTSADDAEDFARSWAGEMRDTAADPHVGYASWEADSEYYAQRYPHEM